MVKIYTRYDTPIEEGVVFVEPTMTQQQFKVDCDLNTILDNFKVTGCLPYIEAPFSSEDFSEGFDYREALHQIAEADAAFMELPAAVRKEFNNDPGEFLDFIDNPNNFERAVELGIFEKDPDPVSASKSGLDTATPEAKSEA